MKAAGPLAAAKLQSSRVGDPCEAVWLVNEGDDRLEPPRGLGPDGSGPDIDVAGASGRFAVVRTLGRGGLGEVLEVHDRIARRTVALKRARVTATVSPAATEASRPAMVSSSFARELLENEYHTLRQLQHPSIIEVYDYGVDEALGTFYTMELLTGSDLGELKPLPWRDTCRILIDVASSLSVVHSRRLVHRDVSARNVRCTASGGAKLLDFGALTEMGVPSAVMGTPPYVAPESLHRQPLDARTDLFALGALAYFVLTGRHAHPARSLDQLREVWLSPVRPVRELCADAPAALSELVEALLHPDPLARPQTASEVMTRLGAIAGIALDENLAVRNAYLTTPKLVGRDAEVLRVRKLMVRATRGRADALHITGALGVGRSRMLDACVLEAQLAGARVARADAKDSDADFAVTRRIATQLLELVGSGADPVAGPVGSWLSSPVGAPPPPRQELLAALTALVNHLGHRQALAIAVDDIDQVDDPSRAWLMSLALQHGAARVMLAFTTSSDVPEPSDLGLLAALPKMQLEPLEADATRALLASVFGEVPNLDLVSAIVQRACAGHPREIMDAAQRLVDDGLARYESGAWFLRDDAASTTASIESGIDVSGRLWALAPDARALLGMLALDRDYRASPRDYAVLCGIDDPARVRSLLSELVRQRWLVHAPNGYRFARPRARSGVVRAMSDTERAQVHRRLAEFCSADRSAPIYEAYHWLRAGVAERAHDALRAYAELSESQPDRVRHAIELEALGELVELGALHGWPRGLLARYRALYVLLCASLGEWQRIVPHAVVTLRALAEFSGLSDYAALELESTAERFRSAHARAEARYRSAPGGDAMAPDEAIRTLPKVATVVAVTARYLFEPALFDAIPDFGPLRQLAPAIDFSQRIIDEYFRNVARGAHWLGWRAARSIHADVRAVEAGRIDERTRYTLELVTLSAACTDDARHAAASTLARCEALDAWQPGQAENYRAMYHLACGDVATADAARRRCEVLSLHAGATADVRRQRLIVSVEIYPLADDLVGLRRLEAELAALLDGEPSWRAIHARAQGHRLRCQGQLDEGLAVVNRSLGELSPGHYEWCPAAELQVLLLSAAGRGQEALERGEEYLAQARRVAAPAAWLELSLATAAAREQRHTAARDHWQSAFAAFEEHGVGGIHMGYAREIGALIALQCDDRAAFESHSQACRTQYLAGGYPALSAKYARLVALGQARFGALDTAIVVGRDPWLAPTSAERDLAQLGADGRPPSSQILFELACTHAGAASGTLFGLRQGRLQRLAGQHDEAIAEVAGAYLSAEVEASENVTMTVGATHAAGSLVAGVPHQPLLLWYLEAGTVFVAGIIMLCPGADGLKPLPASFVQAFGRKLVEAGLVEPMAGAA